MEGMRDMEGQLMFIRHIGKGDKHTPDRAEVALRKQNPELEAARIKE